MTTNAVGVTRLGHVNIVVADHNDAVVHWRRLFDTDFFLFMFVPEVTATNTLGVIGDTCIELFAPWARSSMLGRTLTRRGPGPFAIEFTVEDYDRAEQVLLDRGLRITQADPQRYLWIHPADLGGVAVELSPAHFKDDPRDQPDWSPERWMDGPLGITGLRSISIDVARPAATVAELFADVFGAQVVAEGTVGGRDFVDVEIAADRYRLRSPNGSPQARVGVASLDFAVTDLDNVRRWARASGLPVVDHDNGLTLPEQLNLGTRVEFVQGS